jgi:hypothetical protein
MDQTTPVDTPRVALWKISQEMLGLVMDNLLRLPTWSNQTVYLASQLDIIARITATLKQEQGKYSIGNVLLLRTLLEAVANAITGCNVPEYANEELAKLSIDRKDRKKKSQVQRDRLDLYHPRTWLYATEATLLWTRGNCVVHADADSSFFFRSDGLGAIDLKGLALAIVSLMQGAHTYLESINAFFTQEEWDADITRFRAALTAVVTEGEASLQGDLHDYEARLFAELYKRGADIKLSEKITPLSLPPADPSPDKSK